MEELLGPRLFITPQNEIFNFLQSSITAQTL